MYKLDFLRLNAIESKIIQFIFEAFFLCACNFFFSFQRMRLYVVLPKI